MTGTGLAMGAAQARGKAKVKAGKDLEKEEFSKTAADGSKKEGKECDKKMAGNDAKKVSGSAAAASPQTDRKADSKTTPLAESGSAVTETLVELGNTTNAESTGLRVRSEKTTETDLDFLTEQSLGEAWRRSQVLTRETQVRP